MCYPTGQLQRDQRSFTPNPRALSSDWAGEGTHSHSSSWRPPISAGSLSNAFCESHLHGGEGISTLKHLQIAKCT